MPKNGLILLHKLDKHYDKNVFGSARIPFRDLSHLNIKKPIIDAINHGIKKQSSLHLTVHER